MTNNRGQSQEEVVLEYMESAGVFGITTESARRIGILSLSRRITHA